jgi:hypothetical protein
MKYGHFDDKAREYVIDTPRTPYPWINYLGCEQFFGIISNTAGGYCFYRDARLRRVTRYRYNNMPVDNGGRYFYIKDGDTVWNPGWKPVKTELDSYSCRHGMGYTIITGQKNGLTASQLSFVPMGVNAEVHQVTLRNDSDAPKDEETLKIGPVSVAIGPFGREQHVINARESHVELFGSLVKVGGRHGTFEGDIEEVAARREDTACNRDNDKAAESRVCGGDELFHDGDRFTGTEC